MWSKQWLHDYGLVLCAHSGLKLAWCLCDNYANCRQVKFKEKAPANRMKRVVM